MGISAMRFLVGWDDAREAEMISAFLDIGDASAAMCSSAGELEAAASRETFDAVLLALNFPTAPECLPLFQRLKESQRDVPIVGAWHRGDIHHLAKFLLAGLHSHLQRDEQGEFVLLLTTMLDAAVASARARRG